MTSRPDSNVSDGVRISANPVRQLFDAAAQGHNLKLTCRGCGRAAVFGAHAVWRHFRRKGWSEWLRDVAKRFRCRVCDRCGPHVTLVRDEPTNRSLPQPDKYEWKRELSRRR